MNYREHKENGTNLLLDVAGPDSVTIQEYSISKGTGLLIGVQVSGEIQDFDQVEIGLYVAEGAPLCGFGPFVKTIMPTSKFVMASGLVAVGVYHPQHQSKFAHVTFWTEDNTAKEVELDLKETLNFWEQQMADKEKMELKLMLSGSSTDNKKTFMRDIHVVDLVR